MSSNVRQKLCATVLSTRSTLSARSLTTSRSLTKQQLRREAFSSFHNTSSRTTVLFEPRSIPTRSTCTLRRYPYAYWPLQGSLSHGRPVYTNTKPVKGQVFNLRLSSATASFPGFLGVHGRDIKRFYSSKPKPKQTGKGNSRSSIPNNEDGDRTGDPVTPPGSFNPRARPATAVPPHTLAGAANKHLRDRLPDLTHMHRPTREELLAAATGFWSRLKVRFKWFSIRSVRPFNVDDISAFFSWFIVGHVLWIILGTTTFFSLAIFAVNTVFAQETLARWVGNYLTKSSGVKVIFESAIVPKWGDGVITFKNVFISRRPGQAGGKVSKGSPSTEAAAAAAAARAEKFNETGEILPTSINRDQEEEDTNYTQFDLSLDTVNVTLSFTKWFNSRGLLRDVEIKGVRGVIDRTSVHFSGDYVDPRTYRHEHNPGDFEIDSFKLEDLLVTVHQPGNFRPFSVSVFSCDLPQLRRQWLFYDFLSANVMSGSFDDSLFTIHPRQMHGHFGGHLEDSIEVSGQTSPWKKHSRLRMDGLNIDHLNRGVEGPFSWIREGNVDIVADIMFPADSDESIAKVISDFYDRLEATVTSSQHLKDNQESHILNNDIHKQGGMTASVDRNTSDDDKRFLVMDLRVHLNDIRAAVPIFTKDLSYVNNALVRPIVAFMNSRHTFIPINCRVVKRASEFDGSWTIFDSGLMDDLSAETYQAFAKDVTDDQARRRRFKKVGLWSLQLAVQAFFMGLASSTAI
ncbi:hypothetical protein N7G274_001516 [Stereocaulon virgatum]|uniref:Mitochondrial distribution and morphology protein 31 n=1 Tax=Stereocaulon virgatum TaxID=373712 RepID=A0ABR4AMZ8_9LECA